MILICLGLLLYGIFGHNDAALVASGLFGLASSIDAFKNKYFKWLFPFGDKKE